MSVAIEHRPDLSPEQMAAVARAVAERVEEAVGEHRFADLPVARVYSDAWRSTRHAEPLWPVRMGERVFTCASDVVEAIERTCAPTDLGRYGFDLLGRAYELFVDVTLARAERPRRRSPRRRTGEPMKGARWLAAGALAAGLAGAPAAAAQTGGCGQGADPVQACDYAPRVTLAESASGASWTVTVFWSDDHDVRLHPGTVTLNGVDVTARLSIRYTSPTSATATGTLALSAGTNTLVAQMCDGANPCVARSVTTIYGTASPPPSYAAPAVSLAPYASDWRDVNAGTAAASYTTPAYTSLDQPRAVTLLYGMGQDHPRGFVQMDVTPASAQPPAYYMLRVRRAESFGTWETFTRTSTTTLYFRAGAGTTRLGGQFTLMQADPLSYGYLAELTAVWADGHTETAAPVPFRVSVVNETASTLGRGWSVVGLQRAVWQGDGVHVTQGDGTGRWFAVNASGGYVTPDGDFTTLAGSAAGGWTRTYPDGGTVRFDAAGRMVESRDAFGNATTYRYDASGRLTTITDPAGYATTFGYGTGGTLAYVQDPMGRRVTALSVGGRLYGFVDPDGVRGLEMDLDATRLATAWGRGASRGTAGSGTDYAYDAYGMLASVTAPAIATSTGSVRLATQYRSIEKAIADAAGGSTATMGAGVTPALARAEVTDANGRTTREAVDRFRLPLAVTDADGGVSTTMRDAHGRVLAAIDASGAGVRYTYDDAHRTNPSPVQSYQGTTGASVTFSYSGAAPYRVQSITGDVAATTYFYSGTRPLPDSQVTGTDTTRYEYETRTDGTLTGRTTQVRDPRGHATTIAYQPVGLRNTLSVAAPSASGSGTQTTTLAYDAYGRVSTVTDAAGRRFGTSYDALNRVLTTTTLDTLVTRYGYDDANRLFTVTDPAGHVYTTAVNALGWPTSQADPLGRTESFTYDSHGNVVAYTNRRGGTVSATYDAQGRMLSQTADGRTTIWAYDPAGLWMAVSNPESTDTVRFDADGRTTGTLTRRGVASFTVTPQINTDGTLRSAAVTWNGGSGHASYAYDASLRPYAMYGLTPGAAGTSPNPTLFAYDRDGLLATLTLPMVSGYPQVQQAFAYTASHALQSSTFSAAAVQRSAGRTYAYDALGGTATVARPFISTQGVNGSEQRVLGYDALGQLSRFADVRSWQENVCTTPTSGAFNTGSTCTLTTRYDTVASAAYTYDRAGNRTDAGAVYETGGLRQLQAGGYAMSYDADGNQTRKLAVGQYDRQLFWNTLGQLDSAWVSGVGTVRSGYDGLGRRVRKTVNGVTTQYVYDGDDLVLEADASGAPIREYTYYPGTGQPHSVTDLTAPLPAVYYFTQEMPGRVSALVDVRFDVVANEYRYDPWGKPLNTPNGFAQPLRYGGRYYDAETGLYYNRARYYDPEQGRFVSEDPAGLAGGMNPYAYAANDPVSFTDPTGMSPCPAGSTKDCPLPLPGIGTVPGWYWLLFFMPHLGAPVGSAGVVRPWEVPGGIAPPNMDRERALAEAEHPWDGTSTAAHDGLTHCILDHTIDRWFSANRGIGAAAVKVVAWTAPAMYRIGNGAPRGTGAVGAAIRYMRGTLAEFRAVTWAGEAGGATVTVGEAAVLSSVGEGALISLGAVTAFEGGMLLGSGMMAAAECIVPDDFRP